MMVPESSISNHTKLLNSTGTKNLTSSSKIGRIFGGTPVKSIKDFPYVASLQVEEGVHICSGSIIHHQVILTASQCAIKVEKERLEKQLQGTTVHPKIRVGSVDTTKDGRLFKIDSFYFNGYDENGVALVKLLSQMDLQTTIQNITLSGKKREEKAGADATVVGWGDTSPGQRPNLLHVVHVKLIGLNDCKEKLKEELHDKVCTESKNNVIVSPCEGDEGAPLVSGKVFIGIVGGVPPNFDCTKKTDGFWAHTPIAGHRTWIDQQMKMIDAAWVADTDIDDYVHKLNEVVDKIFHMFTLFVIFCVILIVVVLLVEFGFILFVLQKFKSSITD